MSETTTPSRDAGDIGKSLGQVRVVSLDAEAGRAAIEYRCGMHMCHSGGVAQGGFVTGWIDAAMAHATMAATDEAGNILAKATSTVRLIPRAKFA